MQRKARPAVVIAALLISVTGCGATDTANRAVVQAAPSPAAPVTADTLTRAEMPTAAQRLREAPAPAGFAHDDQNCPRIGDISPGTGPNFACYRTRRALTTLTEATLTRLLSPLQVTLMQHRTFCAARTDPDGHECDAFGAAQRTPVWINVLFPPANTPAGSAWTQVKLQVIHSASIHCEPGADVCVLGQPGPTPSSLWTHH